MSQNDWKELIESLVENRVEFLVVGSSVLAFYARPRFTEDLDLWVRRDSENISRLEKALLEFGFPIKSMALEPLVSKDDQMVALGRKPYAVDILNSVTGLDWEGSWSRAVDGELFGEPVKYLSLRDFVTTKQAVSRKKDLADLAILEEVLGESPENLG